MAENFAFNPSKGQIYKKKKCVLVFTLLLTSDSPPCLSSEQLVSETLCSAKCATDSLFQRVRVCVCVCITNRPC